MGKYCYLSFISYARLANIKWMPFISGVVAENMNSKTTQGIEKNSFKIKTEDEIKVDLLARKEVMERARKELPYTFQSKSMSGT